MKTILSCVLMAYIMVMPMSVLGANITTGPSGIGNTEQLQKKGSVVDLGNIPDVLRSIRENENTMIHNLRKAVEDANRDSAPAALKSVDRAIGVLDENALTLNNFMRRIRDAGTRESSSMVAAVADCLRANAQHRTDVGAMLRQLRQIEAMSIGEIPKRLESLRVSLANGFNAIQQANAAIPEGTAANAPAVQELRQRMNEYQQSLSQAEADLQRITRQLSDAIAANQGNVQQSRALVRMAASLTDAIAGYRQSLRRFAARNFSTSTNTKPR